MSGLNIVWNAAGDDLLLSVRLTPGSAKEAIGGSWTDAQGARWLMARVRAVPEKGRANDALIALLSKRLDWPRSAILLESGDTNRLKRLRIIGGAAGSASGLILTFASPGGGDGSANVKIVKSTRIKRLLVVRKDSDI